MENPENTLKISKLNNKGQGVSDDNPKIILWNALPGETVEYDRLKRKKGKKEGTASKIIESSEFRIPPVEPDHFTSCSPFQICTPEFENDFKLKSTLSKFEDEEITLPSCKLVSIVEKEFGYRNKMEYSFYTNDDEKVNIAFFRRGTHKGKIPIKGCALAHPNINKIVEQFVEWINSEGISGWSLKSLVLRSNLNGDVIAALYAKKEISYKTLPHLSNILKGFRIYFSNPQSPASVPTELLEEIGELELTETINNKTFIYGLESFFQININIFAKVLEDIRQFITTEDDVLDLFSGVGTIGLSIADQVKSVKLVEMNEEADQFAQTNIAQNNITNATSVCSRSENVTDLVTEDIVLFIDPPREGLHKDVIKKINEIKPKKIVYLSCNPTSQIQNIKEISKNYSIEFSRFYNFFPRTTHLESLVVLNKK